MLRWIAAFVGVLVLVCGAGAQAPAPAPSTAAASELVVVLPFASQAHFTPAARPHAPAVLAPGAAIERLEARDQHARVFVVGAASTPVVWLSDDAGDDPEAPSNQDPG